MEPNAKQAKPAEMLPKYILDGCLRRVEPYYYEYLTYCKMRWRDRTLLDIFANEFRLYPKSYYERTLDAGRVFVNGKVAGRDTILKNGALLSHKMHRHEPPVANKPIDIVYQDDEIVVIDKPSGMPVHPTGRYRHNSVTYIMEREMGIKANPCNRLDRLTSGLMFLGKSPQGCDKLVDQIRNRKVGKQYIAKVVGEFPLGIWDVNVNLHCIDPRLALNIVDIDNKFESKESSTTFQRISYDPEDGTSIVLCKPHTGRTHQIRVHLQYLGHPITNDPLYSSPEIWGSSLGKGGEYDVDLVMSKLDKIGKTDTAKSWLHPQGDGEVLNGEQCEECGIDLYSDPGPNDLELYLHAYKYYSTETDWSYQTQLPEWASSQSTKNMSLALDQAKLSPPTQTAFCVGCVLVHNGQVISEGFSRELPGNTHAEQCALEKLGDSLPYGTEVYTTMEPCSLRLSGNLPCLDRILEASNKEDTAALPEISRYKNLKGVSLLKKPQKVTTCFVGVMEPSTFVQKNVSLEKLEKEGIAYIKVDGFEEEAIKIAKNGHELIGKQEEDENSNV